MEFNNVKYGAENDGAIEMVQITPDAEKFINDLLEKNQKVGYGIKIYLSGFACSGPQFGMSFQEKAAEGENVDKSAHGFGIPGMREIAERYGGTLDAGVRDNGFELVVCLPLAGQAETL